jgi:hypothetical protein
MINWLLGLVNEEVLLHLFCGLNTSYNKNVMLEKCQCVEVINLEAEITVAVSRATDFPVTSDESQEYSSNAVL